MLLGIEKSIPGPKETYLIVYWDNYNYLYINSNKIKSDIENIRLSCLVQSSKISQQIVSDQYKSLLKP